jgi:DNA-binding XRE family transcriptional regulator
VNYGENAKLNNGTILLQHERSAWDYAAPAFMLSSVLITGTGSTSNVAPSVNGTYLSCSVRDLLCNHGPLVRSSLRSLLHDTRSNFELNAVEFSGVLGVSRQTLYDWVAERVEPRIDKQRRLRELFALSEQWRMTIGADIQTVNRKFTDKPELLALLSDVSLSSERKAQRLQVLAQGRRGIVGTASINDRLTSLGFTRDPETQQRMLADQGW